MNELMPAFPLHVRQYGETSLIVEMLTSEEGRISLVARGARSPKNKRRAMIQPFTPLLIAFVGRSQLQTLTCVENNGMPILLEGRAMLSGLYLNELLIALLAPHDSVKEIFIHYATCLNALAMKDADIEVVLRQFEFELLSQLGYGICFSHDSGNGREIENDKFYHFHPREGFIASLSEYVAREMLFLGKDIINILKNDFHEPSTKHAARRLTRLCFSGLLGEKKMRTKELFKPIILKELEL